MNIRVIEQTGIADAIDAVSRDFFSRDRSEVERHFQGHAEGDSSTLLGYDDNELVGLLTIRWDCHYPPFHQEGIPFIHYIEIKWERRGQGWGNKLLEQAERFVSRRARRLGICVGIFDAYGPAQRLYAKRGFLPDGRGVCRGHEPIREGETVCVDHELLLWLVKDLDV